MTAPATYHEPARVLPVVQEADVIVCGAGPAGVAAAIAAGRAGARTCLIEVHGCLGGVWTAGQLAWVFDIEKPGLARELTQALDRRGARIGENQERYAYDIEAMKLLLEHLCTEAGVGVRLHTRVVAAACDPSNRLCTVVTESKSGREAWRGKVFVDATGDGDLAAQAGCGFDLGHPDTGQVQPMT
jgi:flavin-dependent dehydrogenase